MDILEYNKKYFEKWDEFVMHESVNGTILQTRKFLSYHAEGRFTDHSLLVEHNGRIVAVCPISVEKTEEGETAVSHKGSTYGGIIVSAKIYKTEKMLQIVNLLDDYYRMRGFKKIIYKVTPDLFCSERSDLLCFCLNHCGYRENQELSFFIDYKQYDKEILRNFAKGRKCNVKNCLKMGMDAREITNQEEIKDFYDLLCISLQKYDTVPVHSYNELLILQKILKDEISFLGVYLNGKMAAGTMLFYFEQSNCLHSQYLAADPALNKLSPMSFLYYSIISRAMEKGCRYLSWGIGTDHSGNPNMNLIQAKEAVGSKQMINRVFMKEKL